MDERHPLLGCATLSAGDFVHRAIEAADLILNIGHDMIEKPPFMSKGGTEVIHISYNTAEVDPVYFPQVEVIGDVGNSVGKSRVKTSEEAGWDFSRMIVFGTPRRQHLGGHRRYAVPLLPAARGESGPRCYAGRRNYLLR